MAGALDNKLFINRAEKPVFVERFEKWISQGVIPPFAFLFQEAETGFVDDKNKLGKDIIQFGFLLRDEKGNVLVSRRAMFGNNTVAGHTVTVGDSVLVGWSPVELPDGRRFPASEMDIRYIFHREVPELAGTPPKCSFIGLVRNQRRKTLMGAVHILQYYFYLFDMQYADTPDFSRVRFRKDQDDQPQAFVPINRDLADTVQDKKADLRALEAVTGSTFPHLDYGESILLKPLPGSLPPFKVHPPGVFISHATSDDTAANLIANSLQKAGISVWCDHRTILPGQSWQWEIADAIKYGPGFVVLCSEASQKSSWVQKEVSMAIERKKHEMGYLLVPVVLEGKGKLDHVFESIRNLLWVADFRDNADRQSQIDALVALARKQTEEYGCLRVNS